MNDPAEWPLRVNDPGANARDYTCGPWRTESESCSALDAILTKLALFTIYREVPGYYVQPRLGQDLRRPRIDRILMPKQDLIARGWCYGPVGIECKRSDEKIGRPIAQLLDYSRALWEIKSGIWIALQWSFLWPLGGVGGPIESVLAQHRLGGVCTSRWADLSFHSGQNLATFDLNGGVRIGAGLNGSGVNGRKAGSR